jgi:hypothetical protein
MVDVVSLRPERSEEVRKDEFDGNDERSSPD